ncbi:MAG: twin-arginine translocase subunit TatC, partial [Armatimonadetes bacterium]|nr:twin-arginine translocase subunit TatC [Armatimonadota bacterium]
MCLAFGVVFQLPVILMFLGKVGIVNSRMLKSYWRQAVVVLAIVAAVVTPSADAFSMMMMCVPMVILYGLSILLVKVVEP